MISDQICSSLAKIFSDTIADLTSVMNKFISENISEIHPERIHESVFRIETLFVKLQKSLYDICFEKDSDLFQRDIEIKTVREITLERCFGNTENPELFGFYTNFTAENYKNSFEKRYFYYRFPELSSGRFGASVVKNAHDRYVRDFVFDSTEQIRKKFLFDLPLPWKRFTVVFLHHFNKNSWNKTETNTDFFHIKRPIDGLLSGTISDDSSENMDIFQFCISENEGDPYTEMYVLGDQNLKEILLEFIPNNGSPG